MDKKREYVEKMKAELEHLDAKIIDLKATMRGNAADASIQAKDKMARLQDQRADAGDRLDKIKDASDDAWESLKDGFDEAFTKIKRAFS